jgi:hypothetical protein
VHDSHRAVVRQVILEVVAVAHPARQHCVPVGVVLIRAQPVVGVVAVHVGRRPVHDQLLAVANIVVLIFRRAVVAVRVRRHRLRGQPVQRVVAVGHRPPAQLLSIATISMAYHFLHVTTSPIEVPTPGKTRLRLES